MVQNSEHASRRELSQRVFRLSGLEANHLTSSSGYARRIACIPKPFEPFCPLKSLVFDQENAIKIELNREPFEDHMYTNTKTKMSTYVHTIIYPTVLALYSMVHRNRTRRENQFSSSAGSSHEYSRKTSETSLPTSRNH